MFLLKRGGAKAGAGGAAQRKAAHRFEPQRCLARAGVAEVGIMLMPSGKAELDTLDELAFKVGVNAPGVAAPCSRRRCRKPLTPCEPTARVTPA
jgi:hypothetical protein